MTTIGINLPAKRLNNCSLFLLVLTVFCFCSCHSVRGQQKNDTVEYDSITQQNVYTFVEKMPVYKGGEYAFFADFVKQFHYSFLANEEIQTKLKVQFVIDEKGHLIGARIYNKKADNLTDFEKAGLQALELMQSWEAGSHNNKNVNVILTQVIHLEYRLIQLNSIMTIKVNTVFQTDTNPN